VALVFVLGREQAHGQNRPVTLNAVGDILFARGIERKIAANGEDYPFRSITPQLKQADVVIGNLETTLSTRPFGGSQQYRFRAVPERAKLLRKAGLTMVNVANNHALDCGPGGLRDTLQALSAEGIKACGAAGAEGQEAVVESYGGVRTAFLAFSDFPPRFQSHPAVTIQYASEETVAKAVRDTRRKADFVVVSFHWGQEQSPLPTDRQKRLAHAAAEAGADLILGHHPHVLQGFEILRAGERSVLVAYSLGNFLFDGHKDAEKQSLILRCSFDRSGLRSAEVLPVQIIHSAPQPATGQERSAILSQVSALSSQLGCHVEGTSITLPPPAHLQN
jgi:poly-gamma-glutamate synthesis protein (capsule biosynthesis protein)